MLGKYTKNKKGQSLVELAILLPVLLLIIMGIFEFGRVMNAYLVITNASREGARAASVGYEDSEIIQKIHLSTPSLDLSKLNINVTPYKSHRTRGKDVTVQVSYDIDIIVPIIEVLVPDPLRLATQTVMRIE